MIMLVVAESKDTTQNLVRFFRERSFNIIHYNSPIKALDNLEEINPDAVLINAVDFPRHWKVLAQYIRWDSKKEDVILLLAVNGSFSISDADKAVKSGVQGVINLNDSIENILQAAESICAKYKPLSSGNSDKELLANTHFLFTEPLNETIVTGKISVLTPENIVFIPDTPVQTMDLVPGSIIEHCSLKIRNRIIVPKCRITSIEEFIDFKFIDLNHQDKETIKDFIDGR